MTSASQITRTHTHRRLLYAANYLWKLKADLDGTTIAYHCRMRFLERTLLASCKKTAHNTRHSTLETLRNDDGMASRRGSRQKVTRSTNSVRRLSSCVTQRWILGRRLVLARNANHSFRRENVEFIGDEARVDLSCVYI